MQIREKRVNKVIPRGGGVQKATAITSRPRSATAVARGHEAMPSSPLWSPLPLRNSAQQLANTTLKLLYICKCHPCGCSSTPTPSWPVRERELMKVLVLMLLIAGISLCEVSQPAMGYADCEDDDIYGLQGHCRMAVWVGKKAVDPTADCCLFVTERTSLACVCENVVTRKHEKYISMRKLAHVARYCGVPLKPGTKCGSYLIPYQS